MFENYTQEYFLELAQRKATERGLDATEGTLIFNAACLMAVMLEDAFDKAEEAYSNAFPDTADREHLIRFCRAAGTAPKAATSCTVKIKTDGDIETGIRLNGDEYSYTVTKKLEDDEKGNHLFEAECDTAGTAPNGKLGNLTAEDEGTDESFCEIVEIITPGTDDEETQALRERYFESTDIPPMSGNRSYYKTATESIGGVGAAKVFGETSADGKSLVKIWITGENGTIATESVRAAVQEAIDPTGGEGDGAACVDHTATVFTAQEEAVDLEIAVTAENGAEHGKLTQEIEDVVEKYFSQLNQSWDSVAALTVKASVIEANIMLLGKIEDVLISIGDEKVRVKSLGNNLGKAGTVNVNYNLNA